MKIRIFSIFIFPLKCWYGIEIGSFCDTGVIIAGGGVLAPQFLGLGSGLASPYGVGVGGVGLPAFGALTLTPASPALRALAAPPLPLATVLLVSNLNEEVGTHTHANNITHLNTGRRIYISVSRNRPSTCQIQIQKFKLLRLKLLLIKSKNDSRLYLNSLDKIPTLFRLSSLMFIGKFIHYANTIASNARVRHHCDCGLTLYSNKLMH